MSIVEVKPPYAQFNGLDGLPLKSGYLYIGTENLDPVTNPISVYWDSAKTIAAAQPIRLINGYPSNNGAAGALFVGAVCSVKTKDQNGALVFSSPSVYDHFGVYYVTSVATFSAISAALATMEIGEQFSLLGHTIQGIGGGIFDVISSSGLTADNGTIVISGAKAAKRKYTYIEMEFFGCVPATTADCGPYLQFAINLQQFDSGKRTPIKTNSCAYTFTSRVEKASSPYGIDIFGDKTTFNYTGLPASTALITTIGGSGNLCQAIISGITANGHATSIFLESQGQCGQDIKYCKIGTNAVGYLLHNKSVGQFTEYCTLDQCEIFTSCTTAMEYRKTSGDQSFHGSGMKNRCLVNTPTTGTPSVLLVGADCLPYNAPLDVQVWSKVNTAVLIKNNNTGTPAINNCNWHGTITIEPFTTITLASGYDRTFFTGTINSNNEATLYGVLKHLDTIIMNSDGNVRLIPKTSTKRNIALTTGANNVSLSWWAGFLGPGPGTTGCSLCHVWVEGPNYYYSYLLSLGRTPYGAGNVVTLANHYAYNVAGYGAPTFALDASNNLVITNAGYPASGVNANISLAAVGWPQP